MIYCKHMVHIVMRPYGYKILIWPLEQFECEILPIAFFGMHHWKERKKTIRKLQVFDIILAKILRFIKILLNILSIF